MPPAKPLISGQTIGGTFPSAPSAPYTSTAERAAFVLKLNSTGSTQLEAIRGVGGWLASDSPGNIYVAGVDQGDGIPITPGAFQSSYNTLQGCGGDSQI